MDLRDGLEDRRPDPGSNLDQYAGPDGYAEIRPHSINGSLIPTWDLSSLAVPSKKCPVCGVSVKLENLERHVRNQHPRTNLGEDQILSAAERKRVKGASATPHRGMTPAGKRVVAVVSVILVLVLALLILNP